MRNDPVFKALCVLLALSVAMTLISQGWVQVEAGHKWGRLLVGWGNMIWGALTLITSQWLGDWQKKRRAKKEGTFHP